MLIFQYKQGVTPAELPSTVDPTIHYDFSDVSTLWQDQSRTSAISAADQVISGVTDKSPGGTYHAIGTGSGNRHYRTNAQNGLSAIQLNTGITSGGTGDDQIYQNTMNDQGLPNTVAIACTYPPDSVDAGMIWDGFNIVLRQFCFRPGNTATLNIGSNLSVATTLSATEYTWVVITVVFDGTSTKTYLNGTLTDDGTLGAMGTNSIRHWRLGNSYTANNGHDMYFGEALFYGATTTSTEVDEINTYLKTKWGIS